MIWKVRTWSYSFTQFNFFQFLYFFCSFIILSYFSDPFFIFFLFFIHLSFYYPNLNSLLISSFSFIYFQLYCYTHFHLYLLISILVIYFLFLISCFLFLFIYLVGDIVKYPSTSNPEGDCTNWTVVQIVRSAVNLFPNENNLLIQKKVELSKIEIPNLFTKNESKALQQIRGGILFVYLLIHLFHYL